MNIFDKYTKWFADFLLSRTVILVVMILFYIGIIQHIQYIFDNWFLSISCQLVVLLTTINSKYLPSIHTKYNVDIPLIGAAVAIFYAWFIYNSLMSQKPAEIATLTWFLNLSEALFFGIIELVFAYLATAKISNEEQSEKQVKDTSHDLQSKQDKPAIDNIPGITIENE